MNVRSVSVRTKPQPSYSACAGALKPAVSTRAVCIPCAFSRSNPFVHEGGGQALPAPCRSRAHRLETADPRPIVGPTYAARRKRAATNVHDKVELRVIGRARP